MGMKVYWRRGCGAGASAENCAAQARRHARNAPPSVPAPPNCAAKPRWQAKSALSSLSTRGRVGRVRWPEGAPAIDGRAFSHA